MSQTTEQHERTASALSREFGELEHALNDLLGIQPLPTGRDESEPLVNLWGSARSLKPWLGIAAAINFALVPERRVSEMLSNAVQARNAVREILNAARRTANSRDNDRDRVYGGKQGMTDLSSTLSQISNQICLAGAMLVGVSGGLDGLALPAFADMKKAVETCKEAISLVPAMRGLVGQTKLSHEADRFMDQAKADRCELFCWLGTAILLGMVLFWYSNAGVSKLEEIAKTLGTNTSVLAVGVPWWIPVLAPRLVLMSAGLALLYWLLQSARHVLFRRSLNLHRAQSLHTMKLYLGAETDPKLRDAIIHRATSAAFDTPTGLMGGSDGDAVKGIVNMPIVGTLPGLSGKPE